MQENLATDPSREVTPDLVNRSQHDVHQHQDANGWLYSPPAPWRRYGARMIDLIIHGTSAFLILGIVLAFVAPDMADILFEELDGPAGKLLDTVLTIWMATLINPFILFLFGSTLGRVIFGIRLRTRDGERLSLKQCLSREFRVLFQGLGMGIPIIMLCTLILGFKKLSAAGETSWDAGRFGVSYRPTGTLQTTLNIVGILIFVAARIIVSALETF